MPVCDNCGGNKGKCQCQYEHLPVKHCYMCGKPFYCTFQTGSQCSRNSKTAPKSALDGCKCQECNGGCTTVSI